MAKPKITGDNIQLRREITLDVRCFKKKDTLLRPSKVGTLVDITFNSGNRRSQGMLKKDDICFHLRPGLIGKPSQKTSNPRFRMAAVLVIIHYTHRIPHVIMTKRNQELRVHSGQVAFPGGVFSKRDRSLQDTAIRETREELGLAIEERSIIGTLRSVRTLTSNYCIIPFVTVQDRISEPQILADEVEKLIDAPLIDLLLTAKIDLEHRNASHDKLYRFTCGEEVIWGATARILKQLYDCLPLDQARLNASRADR